MRRHYTQRTGRPQQAGRPGALLALLCAALVVLGASPALAATGKEVTDEQITRAIETELALDDSVSAHLIDVETANGVVTLSGSVDNALGRDRAVEIAQAIKGTRSVVNRIKIKPVERTDEQIRDDVVAALAVDPAADAYQLDVQVQDAVVTLKGSVDAWAEKQLALNVAKGVRGVRDVKDEMDVEYEAERRDAEIQAEVKRRLEMDARVDDALVDVKVDQGKVSLTGTVGSAAEKSRARTDAWVTGVESVDATDLQVKWWAREEMKRARQAVTASDEKIKKAVKDALLYDPRVFSFKPQVEVDGGVVTLKGEVEDLKAKRAAEEDARNTVGVWKVENRLRVRPKERPSDAQLAQQVRDALKRDPYVERHQINVSVLNGKAYLYGTVDSDFEKWQADDVAARVSGVVEVQNNLTVSEAWTWKDDWKIRQDIESNLYWNPYVDEESVAVAVEDGVATLTGTVDSWYERRRAADEAWEAGAKSVINELRVRGSAPGTPPYGPPYGAARGRP
ncbi:MAG: BON domain-containing protein [bacterium]